MYCQNTQGSLYRALCLLAIHFFILSPAHCVRVATVREKVLEMKNFPGQGKVRELYFQSGKFKKNEKSHGKVREFQNFPKKMLVNRFLEILVSIICKQY